MCLRASVTGVVKRELFGQIERPLGPRGRGGDGGEQEHLTLVLPLLPRGEAVQPGGEGEGVAQVEAEAEAAGHEVGIVQRRLRRGNERRDRGRKEEEVAAGQEREPEVPLLLLHVGPGRVPPRQPPPASPASGDGRPPQPGQGEVSGPGDPDGAQGGARAAPLEEPPGAPGAPTVQRPGRQNRGGRHPRQGVR